ncbi:hypothetical protein CG007_01090 [Mesoplasma entomophilum]|uniref:Uncharacterized protein n=1 Tax=Mesoplasma entomophilum TaxID=2149 RepID=A0A3S5XZB7_9MOLU|nr:hypothetical protein [Mesoplasma entomophilum]ATQ35357.1 hypothetical protein CS528_01050 [Mesoplasma entomophilum]ATZ19310.1 hypothetical protein MENTO_v1c02020 [Mesoplasma entomophilum]AVN60216.1 hypothetical protein CG007_01090 [Mesoplasma entomophilum]
MDKQLSRSELHKDQIKEMNKKSVENRDILAMNSLVSSSLETLKNIDPDFFTRVEKVLNQENDNVKFHLEHDPEIKHFNYEIISQLNDSLDELKKIQSYELSGNGNSKSEIMFQEKEFYKKELEDLLNSLNEKNRKFLDRVNNSEAYKTNYAGDKNQTLAKSFLSDQEKKIIAQKIDGNKTLIHDIRNKQREKMHNLTQSKKRFKINTKIFTFVFAGFTLVGLIGIIIIFFI